MARPSKARASVQISCDAEITGGCSCNTEASGQRAIEESRPSGRRNETRRMHCLFNVVLDRPTPRARPTQRARSTPSETVVKGEESRESGGRADVHASHRLGGKFLATGSARQPNDRSGGGGDGGGAAAASRGCHCSGVFWMSRASRRRQSRLSTTLCQPPDATATDDAGRQLFAPHC